MLSVMFTMAFLSVITPSSITTALPTVFILNELHIIKTISDTSEEIPCYF